MIEEFGIREGINEVIGITKGDWINTAPLGLNYRNGETFIRLYSNHTRKFLEKTGVLYVNVIHDPLVFVISAFEDLGYDWFERIDPPVIKGALSLIEFEAEIVGNTAKLAFKNGELIEREVIAVNRGFNAVIEATVHATRYVISKNEELLRKIEYYGRIVDRCGGKREKEAYRKLMEYIQELELSDLEDKKG